MEITRRDFLKGLAASAVLAGIGDFAGCDPDKLSEEEIWEYIDYAYTPDIAVPYITKQDIRNMIRVESRDNPKAKSSADARGLMQLTYIAHRDVEGNEKGIRSYLSYLWDASSPKRNVKKSTRYLVKKIDRYLKKHPNWKKLSNLEKKELAFAAYNAGPTSLARKGYDLRRMP